MGWVGYFGFCETPEVLIALTRWVRLRLRAALWRQWKTPRRRRAALIALGVKGRLASNTAGSGLGPWHLARTQQQVLQIARTSISIWHVLAQLLEPPYTRPVRTVVWEGRRREASPYPDLWHIPAIVGRIVDGDGPP